MNFYREQDQARKQTLYLVSLFCVAVFSLILLTNLCVAVFVWYSDPSSLLSDHPTIERASGSAKLLAMLAALGWAKALSISTLVSGVIGIAMWFKWSSLKQGGGSIAESLGGKQVMTNTDDLNQRKLLNVVAEMALASGVPVPPVYVMTSEQGINAFAAGLTLKDAVISVSDGAIRSLNREQLQGVVAHEFSHILNGDMRLNIRIVAVLHGILMIGETGRTALHWGLRSGHRSSFSRSNRKGNGLMAGLAAFGIALMAIGWLGQFFGAVIKSAVSRQREYLADASAVQFTRNPEGIGGALRVIGGHTKQSLIGHKTAHELGHLFFSQAYRGRWFATHPPLDERIKRILPAWGGAYLDADSEAGLKADLNEGQAGYQDPSAKLRQQIPKAAYAGLASLMGGLSVEAIDERDSQNAIFPVAAPVNENANENKSKNKSDIEFEPTPEGHNESELLSQKILTLAAEPLGSVGIILALLIDHRPEISEKQFDALRLHGRDYLALIKSCLVDVERINLKATLVLIELLMPSLKCLSKTQYLQVRNLMSRLIQADGRVDLMEWVLFELIRQHGDRHFALAREMSLKFKTPISAQGYYSLVLSRLIHLSTTGAELQQKAFDRASNIAGMYSANLLSVDKCTSAAFTRAVHELTRSYPLLKPRLIKGLIHAAHSDGKLHDHERALINTIALIWDCPLMGLELP